MISQSSKPIGMFDSGVGGLTVMQQLMHRMPQERIVYFGDTARLPYGDKSPEMIVRFSLENTALLQQHDIKLLLIACNTASAYAAEAIRSQLSVPIVEVIQPGARQAANVTKNQRIAVLGTKGTIRSGIYQKEIQRIMPSAKVFGIACPLFVPLVEEEFIYHPVAKLIVKEYLTPLKDLHVDTILLGCTHYPLLQKLIQNEMENATIINSATCCAEEVEKLLREKGLLASQSEPISEQYRYLVSDDPEKFRHIGEAFLGHTIPYVEMIDFFYSLN
jgi:glutamate racemase